MYAHGDFFFLRYDPAFFPSFSFCFPPFLLHFLAHFERICEPTKMLQNTYLKAKFYVCLGTLINI